MAGGIPKLPAGMQAKMKAVPTPYQTRFCCVVADAGGGVSFMRRGPRDRRLLV
jgi:hypothetical protein